MRGAIAIKAVKDVACEEWGQVAGRVVSFCNIDVTEIAKFGSGIIARIIGLFTGSEKGRDRNFMTNEINKLLIENIYIYHHLVTYVKNS